MIYSGSGSAFLTIWYSSPPGSRDSRPIWPGRPLAPGIYGAPRRGLEVGPLPGLLLLRTGSAGEARGIAGGKRLFVRLPNLGLLGSLFPLFSLGRLGGLLVDGIDY